MAELSCFLTITTSHILLLTMPRSPRTPSTSNSNISNAQKQQIAAHYNAQIALNPSYTHAQLQDWARQTFQLSYTPSKSTISRLLNHPPPDHSPSSSKKRLPSHSEELDRLLAEWVQSQQSQNLMVNSHVAGVSETACYLCSIGQDVG